MKRPRWSKHKKLAALFSLGIAASVANAQAPIVSVATGGAGRTPVATQSVSARIPGSYGLAAPGANQANPLAPANQPAIFEGPASTDYFNNQNVFGTNSAANPQIAVGPEDILMVVNSQIFRVQNGNAPGVIPPTVYPAQTAFVLGTTNQTIGATPASFQRAFLDQWIGQTALSQLCPTGDPLNDSTNARVIGLTCLFENATVKYDQLQGRFLVLFTVTDTGLTQGAQGQSFALTRPRKSSWVLLVSRFAVLADQAVLQGTSTTATNPVSNGAGTSIFITPSAPLAGGINANTWSIVYGDSLAGLGTDNFGSQVSSRGVGAGNINANSTLAAADAPTFFNCDSSAIYNANDPVAPLNGTVCYLPTSARLGIDNDTVTIVSSVINGNIPNANSGPAFSVAPLVGAGATATANLTPGPVTSITVTNGGTGYTTVPAVTLSAPPAGPNNKTATATATVANGVVVGITITNAGVGYTAPPAVNIAPPTTAGGVTATATANFASSPVTSITVTNPGSNYTTAPIVTIAPPTTAGGTTATATATVANGIVTGIIVTSAGSGYINPPTVTITAVPGSAVPTTPDYAGTRVRVIKKSALYTRTFPGGPALAAGNQFAAASLAAGNTPGRVNGDYYDLYTATTFAGTPVLNNDQNNLSPNMPFTVVASSAPCLNTAPFQGSGPLIPGVNSNFSRCTPIFYEPAHLRGRAQATFSNSSSGVGAASLSQTYLLGAIYNSTLNTPTQFLFLQGIREIYPVSPATPGAGGVFGLRPFYPVLQNAPFTDNNGTVIDPCAGFNPYTCVAANNGALTASFVRVEPFFNPLPVQQQNGPPLSVGDDRPQVLIFREGHLYDARVGVPSNPTGIFTGGQLLTTVIYDVIQKLNNGPVGPVPGALTIPNPVLGTKWQNTSAYAPMFDVPANVSRVGAISPINVLPYLEKLFVATTFPPLAGNPLAPITGNQLISNVALDPFQPTGGDPRSRQTFGVSGQSASQLPASANCWNYQYSPGPSNPDAPGTTTNNPLAFSSLFDMRCGQDVTNSNPQIRNPFTGVLDSSGGSTGLGSAGSAFALTHRGGASIDPNDGSMWNYGAYAQQRATSTNSLSHFGTFAANYKLSFPAADPYGNNYNLYTDIAGLPEAPYILMAANNGLATYPGAFPAGVNGNATNGGPDAPNTVAISSLLANGPNATLYGPATGNNRVPGAAPGAGQFGPNDEVTRREMAYWIVKSLMDESAITAELKATSPGGVDFATFADVPVTDPGWRYIEIMVRRGYTSGCAAGAARRYCPDYIATRKDLAVFMIRAKFNNVFPSLLSGCSFGFVNGTTSPGGTNNMPGLLIPPAITTNCANTGDNFGVFVTGLPYFTDNPQQTGNDEWVYLQKMRELRITNGTSLGPNNDGRNGTYGRGTPNLPASQYAASTIAGSDASQLNGNLLRKQVAVFMVRGFFF